MNNEAKNLKIALLAAGLMLCFAVIPLWPYGYYTLLRVIVFATAGFAAYRFKNMPKFSKHLVPLAAVAILFNPLIPVNLSRIIWLPIDLGGAIYFLFLARKL